MSLLPGLDIHSGFAVEKFIIGNASTSCYGFLSYLTSISSLFYLPGYNSITQLNSLNTYSIKYPTSNQFSEMGLLFLCHSYFKLIFVLSMNKT